MAFRDDAQWEAADWQMDRFNLATKPADPPSGIFNASAKILGLFSTGPKAAHLCQVRRAGGWWIELSCAGL